MKTLNLSNVVNCVNNSKQVLSLPIYPEIEKHEIKYICEHINFFYAKIVQ